MDTISRAAAIEAIRNIIAITGTFDDEILLIDKTEAQTELMKLPSAQPDIIRCKDCKWWDKYGENHGYCMRVRRWGEYFCADAERREE